MIRPFILAIGTTVMNTYGWSIRDCTAQTLSSIFLLNEIEIQTFDANVSIYLLQAALEINLSHKIIFIEIWFKSSYTEGPRKKLGPAMRM